MKPMNAEREGRGAEQGRGEVSQVEEGEGEGEGAGMLKATCVCRPPLIRPSGVCAGHQATKLETHILHVPN